MGNATDLQRTCQSNEFFYFFKNSIGINCRFAASALKKIGRDRGVEIEEIEERKAMIIEVVVGTVEYVNLPPKADISVQYFKTSLGSITPCT